MKENCFRYKIIVIHHAFREKNQLEMWIMYVQ